MIEERGKKGRDGKTGKQTDNKNDTETERQTNEDKRERKNERTTCNITQILRDALSNLKSQILEPLTKPRRIYKTDKPSWPTFKRNRPATT